MSAERLEDIYNLISDFEASGKDYPLSIHKLFQKLKDLTEVENMDPVEAKPEVKSEVKLEEKPEIKVEEIIISCDASITKNPGGTASAAYIIRMPGKPRIIGGRVTPSKTINEAEYDAIYEGLVRLSIEGRILNPIVIYSDSKLVVNQLMGTYKINHDRLKNKFDSVHELARKVGVPVEIRWAPRNSTEDLRDVNFHAQDLINVPRH